MKIKLFTERLIMLPIALRLLASSFLLLCGSVHGQAACPPGTIPYGTGNDLSACGPDNSAPPQQPSRPHPPPQQWKDHWGAVATDFSHGSVGIVDNAPSQGSAEQAATADCQAKGGLSCKIEIAYRNECAALVAGDKGHVTRAGATVDAAVQAGVEKCRKEDTNCKAYFTGCSQPVRIQ